MNLRACLGGLAAVSMAACGADSSQDDVDTDKAAVQVQDLFRGLDEIQFGLSSKSRSGLCEAIMKTDSMSDQTLRSGIFYGVTGSASVSGISSFIGQDFVWDLYHHQYGVSRYRGHGIVTEVAALSAQAHVGVAFGFTDGVRNWNGTFVEGAVKASLPFLKEYLSVGASGFVTAVDLNRNGKIESKEILKPPHGVYGVAAHVSVGAGIPTGLPVGLEANEAVWVPNGGATRAAYYRMKRAGVSARLVNRKGVECASSWSEGPSDECVVEIGEGTNQSQRGREVAKSICATLDKCVTPFSQALASSAVVHGVLRELHEGPLVVSKRRLADLLACESETRRAEAASIAP